MPQKYPPERMKKTITFLAAPGDVRALKEIQENLGVGTGEAIRTAIRVYVAILKKPK